MSVGDKMRLFKDLYQYRERIDDEFVQFPHMPELWKKPIYKD